MKKAIIIFLAFFAGVQVKGQVVIRQKPDAGFEKRISDFVDNLSVVDTHEHLVSQKGITKSGMFDFMLLFHHYAKDDIRSAGMSTEVFKTLVKDSLPVPEKWTILKPYLDKSFNTAYNRVVFLTADKLFGVSRIDETTVQELTSKIRKAYETDWYKTILKEKCRIEYIIEDGSDYNVGDTSIFRFTKRFDYFQLDSKAKIDLVATKNATQINTLDDLVSTFQSEFEKSRHPRIVSLKTAVAYFRSLHFEDVSKEKAETAFRQIMESGSSPLPFDQVKPLSDYMMHRMLELARKYHFPVQIHTGLQAGDGNYIENSNPALLANLFLKYRDVQFILFHGGYPFGGELATLAKNFRNVYLDMCWLYIISPSYSERYLHEWLETVPASKIMAFGGDYENVENVYGHLLFARQIVARVLTEKVRNGWFSEKEALQVARMILHDNAVSLFHLDKSR